MFSLSHVTVSIVEWSPKVKCHFWRQFHDRLFWQLFLIIITGLVLSSLQYSKTRKRYLKRGKGSILKHDRKSWFDVERVWTRVDGINSDVIGILCTGTPTLTITHAIACKSVRANGFEPHAMWNMACDSSATPMAVYYSQHKTVVLFLVMFQPTAKKRNERIRTQNVIRTAQWLF
jgi:hypothetical protein